MITTAERNGAHYTVEDRRREDKSGRFRYVDSTRIEVKLGENVFREKVVYRYFSSLRWQFGIDIPKPFFLRRRGMAIQKAGTAAENLRIKYEPNSEPRILHKNILTYIFYQR